MVNKIAKKALECAIKRGKINPVAPAYEVLRRQKRAVHDEAVELLVAKYSRQSSHIPAYTEDEEEAADVVIAALNYLQLATGDAMAVIEAKMNYNETRED